MKWSVALGSGVLQWELECCSVKWSVALTGKWSVALGTGVLHCELECCTGKWSVAMGS